MKKTSITSTGFKNCHLDVCANEPFLSVKNQECHFDKNSSEHKTWLLKNVKARKAIKVLKTSLVKCITSMTYITQI